MAKILISSRMFPKLQEPMAKLAAAGHTIVANPYSGQTLSEEQLLELIPGVDAVIAGDDYFTAKVLQKADQLKVIAKVGVGVDRVDLAAATEHGIVVANAPGSNKHAVADMVIGLMLACARQIPYVFDQVKEGKWQVITGTELWEKTIGVAGLGQIGKEVVRRAKGFNMKILAYEPYPDQNFVQEFGVELVDLTQLISRADFISLNLPSLPETRGVVNKELLSKAKPGVFLINTARGDIVEENALYEALTNGTLGGAALDVMSTEPPGADHPLFKLKNVIVTSHIGAHTHEAQLRAGLMATENALRVLAGQKPLFITNNQVYEKLTLEE